ncbi:MAG: hypothetical protein PHF74_07260 [Dehalococcoidales bacterium]|nr:hypothetical protein [Dehalococcoidales bacterium]
MDTYIDRIELAAKNTLILRLPKQKLSAFDQTNIKYYMITEPIYKEPGINNAETILRQGYVIAEKPRIVTPYYLSRLEGFSSEARNYFNRISEMYGADSPGIYYTYRNESRELSIIPDTPDSVVDKINKDIEVRGENLSAIILGIDDLWDVSLLKFIYEITRSSVDGNLTQFESLGLLNIDSAGIPFEARLRIEELFDKLALGEISPNVLKNELKYWGLFEIYQDQFLTSLRSG